MNGPDHYKEAERLTAVAGEQYRDSAVNDPAPLWALIMQQAQVHATLAQAAAAAEESLGFRFKNVDAWDEVL